MGDQTSLSHGNKETAASKGKKGWIVSRSAARWFILLLLLLAGIVWYGFYTTHTKEIGGSDDREYASIARNIVDGKGIVRNFIYPIDIHFFGKAPIPEFVHPPGYPLLIAGFFKLFGVSDFVALLPSYLSYFFLLLLLFFFVKRDLGIQAAVLTAVVFIFNKEVLEMSLVALSEAPYTLVFTLFFILWIRANSLWGIFIASFFGGASYLIRENIYPFLLPLFFYLFDYPDLPRWKKMVLFVMGFLIPMIPNMIRKFSETGSFFFSYGKFTLMAFTEKYPWLTIYRDIQNPSLIEFFTDQPGQFILKYLNNLIQAVEQMLSITNPYLMAFFLIEMFYWKVNPKWKRIKMLFLFLLVFQIFFISLFTYTQRFFIPFLPIIILFASQSMLRISEVLVTGVQIHWRKRMIFLSLVLFLIFFMMSSIYLILQPKGPPLLNFKTPQYGFLIHQEEARKLNEFLRRELKENQVIWTDLPEILEWEGNRLCGWLPQKIGMVHEIHKKFPVDAILLTNLRTPYKMEEEWRYLLFSEFSLPQYRSVKHYQSGIFFAKLLIRDERE